MYRGPCKRCDGRPALDGWDICYPCREAKLGNLQKTREYKEWVRGWSGEVKSLSWSAREYMGRGYDPFKWG